MTVKMKRARWRFKTVLSIIIFLALIGSTAFFFLQYKDVKKNAKPKTSSEVELLLKKVGTVYHLPAGTPGVVFVDDVQDFKGLDFYRDVQVGDAIILFPQVEKVLIYRESANKIINEGHLSSSVSATEESTTTTVVPVETTAPEQALISIDILAKNNDSNQTTARINRDFEGKVKTNQISTDATFGETIVLVNNQAHVDVANKIASALGGKVGPAPAGQEQRSADIVVFVKT